MNAEFYIEKINEQIDICKSVLCYKSDEYATKDKLHNFKVAAQLQGVSLKQALAGMLAKHTVSIYDMCVDGKEHSAEKWTEKITDHINYLLILKASLFEENS